MKIKIDDKNFFKDMNNFVAYAEGFLEGIQVGKPLLFENVAEQLKSGVEDYIDASARVNPSALHHVYEWYETGNPNARLFEIKYIVAGDGISFNGTLSQSRSIREGSTVPFYNKANVMESGMPVTIFPTRSSVLAFEDEGETVFTRQPIMVTNPGGDDVSGTFANTLKEFFSSYLSQSMLEASGLRRHLENPISFKNNASAGARGGRSVGTSVGLKFISGGVQI
jgi:hypothetical protein